MVVSHLATAADFLARAEPFLLRNEAANCLPLGVAANLRAHPERITEPPYLAVAEDNDKVMAAALRAAPWNLALALNESHDALGLIARDTHTIYPNLPGVVGPHPTVQHFVEAWGWLTGRKARVKMAMRTYQLTQVKPPANVPGHFRRATAQDKDLLVRWRIAFTEEALGEIADLQQMAEVVEASLTSPVRGIGVWEVNGQAVSTAAYTGPTPNGMRIGGVYTPPELRGRGYASACVAALSQHLLDNGRRFVFLFTDLLNPTSNKIYMNIGYQPVCDASEYAFEKVESGG